MLAAWYMTCVPLAWPRKLEERQTRGKHQISTIRHTAVGELFSVSFNGTPLSYTLYIIILC